MSAAMIRRLGPLALVALQGWACGEPRLPEGFSEGLTRIRLAPSEFVGSVPCRKDTPGALQTYVATILEVTSAGADAGFTTSFTSGAVPCDQAVMVPSVAGRWYAAEVYGFDGTVSDAERAPRNARWTASCGRGNAFPRGDAGLDPYRPTLAQRGFTVPMRSCTSFFGGGDGASQLVVDQIGALGTRRCGLGAGEVSAFRGTLEGVSRTAACGQPLVFDVAGVERYHSIELIGFEASGDAGSPPDAAAAPPDGPSSEPPDASIDAGDALLDAGSPPAPEAPDGGGPSDAGAPPLVLGTPRWRTQCVGRSLPGVASPAFCDPLTPLP
jgi:hypothetical protein